MNQINTDDSGIQTTPKSNRESKINNNEVSFTDNKTESQSTPVQGKKSDDSYEMFKMIQTMLDMKFSEQKSDSDACLLYTSRCV